MIESEEIPIRPPGRVLARLMRATGLRAFVTPRVVYLRADCIEDERMRRHQRMHAEQMRADGFLRFLWRYAYWSATYGARLNPYETEARSAETRKR